MFWEQFSGRVGSFGPAIFFSAADVITVSTVIIVFTTAVSSRCQQKAHSAVQTAQERPAELTASLALAAVCSAWERSGLICRFPSQVPTGRSPIQKSAGVPFSSF